MKDYVKVRQVGDSVVITIPRELLKVLGWDTGERVLVEATEEGLWVVRDER